MLLIKHHPRQDTNKLIQSLEPYDHSRWMISYLHLFQLCKLSDVVISTWTSGTLNSLAVGKPVIEFWIFGNNNPLWRRSPDGTKTSIYRELGLAIPANTSEELGILLESAINKNDDCWDKQLEAFDTHCGFETNASVKIVNCLLEEVEKKSSGKRNTSYQKKLDELLADQIAYGENLIEKGEIDKALEYFELLGNQNPHDGRVFNNIGVLEYNKGNIDSAIRNFKISLDNNPVYVDAAINIVDVLLAQRKSKEAMKVIIDFLSNSSNKNKEGLFNLSLSRPFSDEQFLQLQQAMQKGSKQTTKKL